MTVALLLVSATSAFAHTAEGNEAPSCERTVVPVALLPGEPATTRVVGWLCARPPTNGGTVHVLLSGFTYGHVYWDFPFEPGQYSYVRALTAAGYATFNFDRIGIGESDKPPAAAVTIQSNAFVAHQIVQRLRASGIGGVRFSKVVLVGHSMGSAMAIVEAAQFGDVDGVVLSRLSPQPRG